MTYEGPVRASDELARILALPRRKPDAEGLRVLARTWSRELMHEEGQYQFDKVMALPEAAREAELARWAKLKNQGGENCPLMLLPVQAQMLWEGNYVKGLFAPVQCGGGKTLVSFLLPAVIPNERPVLFVPASVLKKTQEEFRDFHKIWRAPPVLPEIVTYETLGARPLLLCSCSKCQRGEIVDAPPGLRPTMLICDESHKFRRQSAGRTKRVHRYMSKHAETMCFMLSGTSLRTSIEDIAPSLVYALKFGAPVPMSWVVMQEWRECLDFKVRGKRRDPGALLKLAEPGYAEGTELEAVQEGFQRRLLETWGVVTSEEQSCTTPITLRFHKAPEDQALNEAFAYFRGHELTLDDWDVDDPLSALTYGTQMGSGFYLRWDPRPPREWLDKRKAASIFIRETIKASQRSGRPLDTQAQVYQAHPFERALREWKAIAPSFIPETVAVPITVSVFMWAIEWLRANGPALVWVSNQYVGETLSAMSGIPYFGPGGKDAAKNYIMDHDPSRSAILSLKANTVGRNLQAWNKNLVLGPPPSEEDWEQAIFGRTHRGGQDKPVTVDVLISCAENLLAVDSAYEKAKWVRTTSRQTQKILLADFNWDNYPAIELADLPEDHPARARWNK